MKWHLQRSSTTTHISRCQAYGMEIALRKVQQDEEVLVFSFLTLAARMPEGDEPIQKALCDPALNRYWLRWGRPSDIGIAAEVQPDGMPIACAWLRLYSKEQAGRSFLSEQVPELAMGVIPKYRGNGVGTRTQAASSKMFGVSFRVLF